MKKHTLWSISEQENKADFGAMRIKNEVIATIAATAASEVDGVARAGGSISSRIKGLFSNKIYDRGALVEFNEEHELKITVYVIAKYGANLPNLAASVQSNIRLVIEKMTGIAPLEVNVIIQGVQPLK